SPNQPVPATLPGSAESLIPSSRAAAATADPAARPHCVRLGAGSSSAWRRLIVLPLMCDAAGSNKLVRRRRVGGPRRVAATAAGGRGRGRFVVAGGGRLGGGAGADLGWVG